MWIGNVNIISYNLKERSFVKRGRAPTRVERVAGVNWKTGQRRGWIRRGFGAKCIWMNILVNPKNSPYKPHISLQYSYFKHRWRFNYDSSLLHWCSQAWDISNHAQFGADQTKHYQVMFTSFFWYKHVMEMNFPPYRPCLRYPLFLLKRIIRYVWSLFGPNFMPIWQTLSEEFKRDR